MIEASRLIGTGLATTGLIIAGISIGVVFGALISVVARNTSIRDQWGPYAIFISLSSLLGLGFFIMMNVQPSTTITEIVGIYILYMSWCVFINGIIIGSITTYEYKLYSYFKGLSYFKLFMIIFIYFNRFFIKNTLLSCNMLIIYPIISVFLFILVRIAYLVYENKTVNDLSLRSIMSNFFVSLFVCCNIQYFDIADIILKNLSLIISVELLLIVYTTFSSYIISNIKPCMMNDQSSSNITDRPSSSPSLSGTTLIGGDSDESSSLSESNYSSESASNASAEVSSLTRDLETMRLGFIINPVVVPENRNETITSIANNPDRTKEYFNNQLLNAKEVSEKARQAYAYLNSNTGLNPLDIRNKAVQELGAVSILESRCRSTGTADILLNIQMQSNRGQLNSQMARALPLLKEQHETITNIKRANSIHVSAMRNLIENINPNNNNNDSN